MLLFAVNISGGCSGPRISIQQVNNLPVSQKVVSCVSIERIPAVRIYYVIVASFLLVREKRIVIFQASFTELAQQS